MQVKFGLSGLTALGLILATGPMAYAQTPADAEPPVAPTADGDIPQDTPRPQAEANQQTDTLNSDGTKRLDLDDLESLVDEVRQTDNPQLIEAEPEQQTTPEREPEPAQETVPETAEERAARNSRLRGFGPRETVTPSIEKPEDLLGEQGGDPSVLNDNQNGLDPTIDDPFAASDPFSDEGFSSDPGFGANEFDTNVAPIPKNKIGTRVVLRTLDKVTALTKDYTVNVGDSLTYSSLRVDVKHCEKTPPTLTPETYAFLQIFERQTDGKGQAIEPSKLFSGWMFGSSPALNALEHGVYDVWVVRCEGGDADPEPAFRPPSAPKAAKE